MIKNYLIIIYAFDLNCDRLMGTGSSSGLVGQMLVVVLIGAWEGC